MKIKILFLIFFLSSIIFTKSYAANVFIFTQNLKLGMTSPDVLELQKVLNSDPQTIITNSGPGSAGNETQYFGKLTEKAVINFQKKYSISPAAGYVGPVTRNQLNILAVTNTNNSQTNQNLGNTSNSSTHLNNNINNTDQTNTQIPLNQTETNNISNNNVNINQFNDQVFQNQPEQNNTTNGGSIANNNQLNAILNNSRLISNNENNITENNTPEGSHTVDIKLNGLDSYSEAQWVGSPNYISISILKNNQDICYGSSTPPINGWDKQQITEDLVQVNTYTNTVFELQCLNSTNNQIYKDVATMTRLPDITTISGGDDGPECQASLVRPSAAGIAASISNVKNLRTCTMPSDWTRISCRNYSGDLSRPGEFYGMVSCGSASNATNFRYNLRSYFETNIWRQTGYTGSNKVNIQASSDGTVTWWVSN